MVCFQLTRKSNLGSGPVQLTVIDEEICKHLGLPVHPVNYCHNWYNTIGFGLACGKSFDRLREVFKSDLRSIEIINYLDANFTTNAFYAPRSIVE